MHYNDFLNVEDWKILDSKICRFFNEDETPFEAICVEIGTMTTFKTNINGCHMEKQPIIRWISRLQYETLKKNSGVVIF